jgi:hypothetical protein
MKTIKEALLSCLVVILAGCGAPKEVESPAGEGAAGEVETKPTATASSETGPVTVEFMGVKYVLEATPYKEAKGWGVEIKVTATITDGKDHVFVKDIIDATEVPQAIRFVVDVCGQCQDESLEETDFSAGMDLVTISPGEPVVFERDFPAVGRKGVGPGSEMGLTVGIWGTEAAEGGQRYAPELAHISMVVSQEDKVTMQVAAIDPNELVPKDYVSWEIGSHQLVIKPFYPLKEASKRIGGETVMVYEVGETEVRLKDEELLVDNMFYGALEQGDAILVDHGKVMINGDEKEGEELIKAKLLDFHDNPVSEHELGDHKLIMSPGAVKFGKMNIGNTYKLVLDGKEIMLKEGKLYVEGVYYGPIKKKATIKIYFDEITVGKKKLKPVEPKKEK